MAARDISDQSPFADIGAALVETVETHRRNITAKVGLHSIAELTKYAVREGLTRLE